MGAITGCLEVASYRERFEEHRYICENGPQWMVSFYTMHRWTCTWSASAWSRHGRWSIFYWIISRMRSWICLLERTCRVWSSSWQARQLVKPLPGSLVWIKLRLSAKSSRFSKESSCLMRAEWCHIRKVDAALLTDSNMMLSRIVIKKDITTGAMAEELRLDFQKTILRYPTLIKPGFIGYWGFWEDGARPI